MKRRQLTFLEEREIARRIRTRKEYSTKNIMAEFQCSRSLIDRITRDVEKALCMDSRGTKQNACIGIDATAQACGTIGK